jgi:plastocyanin/flavin-binding protein dodecin
MSALALPLDMTCTIHGNGGNMSLRFVEDTSARAPGTIEIIGGSNNSAWTVRIDGDDKTPATQTTSNPGEVPIKPGDEITWSVTGSFHGVSFTSEDAADDVLDFSASVGFGTKNIGNGKFTWGTDGKGPGTTLAVATVKGSAFLEIGQMFVGESANESFDEAYQAAASAAQDELVTADQLIDIEVVSIKGERGGIAGIENLVVTVQATVRE